MEKETALFLGKIPYNDRYAIANFFSSLNGKTTFLLPKKSGKMPDYLVEYELVYKKKPNGGLATITSISLASNTTLLYANPIQNVVRTFVAEMVSNTMATEEKNEIAYEFLSSFSSSLIDAKALANLPCLFLLIWTKIIGIGLSLEEVAHAHLFEPEVKSWLKSIQINPTQPIEQSNTRKLAIDQLLDYYRVHLETFKEPKSLSVIQEVLYA